MKWLFISQVKTAPRPLLLTFAVTPSDIVEAAGGASIGASTKAGVGKLLPLQKRKSDEDQAKRHQIQKQARGGAEQPQQQMQPAAAQLLALAVPLVKYLV